MRRFFRGGQSYSPPRFRNQPRWPTGLAGVAVLLLVMAAIWGSPGHGAQTVEAQSSTIDGFSAQAGRTSFSLFWTFSGNPQAGRDLYIRYRPTSSQAWSGPGGTGGTPISSGQYGHILTISDYPYESGTALTVGAEYIAQTSESSDFSSPLETTFSLATIASTQASVTGITTATITVSYSQHADTNIAVAARWREQGTSDWTNADSRLGPQFFLTGLEDGKTYEVQSTLDFNAEGAGVYPATVPAARSTSFTVAGPAITSLTFSNTRVAFDRMIASAAVSNALPRGVVYFRWRPANNQTWSAVENVRGATPATLLIQRYPSNTGGSTFDRLVINQEYIVQASLDSAFTSPTEARITPGLTNEATVLSGSSARVRATATPDPTSSFSITLRYRLQGSTRWTTTSQRAVAADSNSALFGLTSLSAGTYEMQSSLSTAFFESSSSPITTFAMPEIHRTDATADTATTATVSVTIAGPTIDNLPVYIRWRDQSDARATWSEQTLTTSTSVATGEITGLTYDTSYRLEASLSSTFSSRPGLAMLAVFTTPLGVEIHRTDAAADSPTAATVTVTIAEGTLPNLRVYIRWRDQSNPRAAWSTRTLTTSTSVASGSITGLTPATSYRVESSLRQTFTATPELAQLATFSTQQRRPATLASVEATNAGETMATVTATLNNPDGASTSVYLRYRALVQGVPGPFSTTITSGTSGTTATFNLIELEPGTIYAFGVDIDPQFSSPTVSSFVTTGGGAPQPQPIPVPAVCTTRLGTIAGQAVLGRVGEVAESCPFQTRGSGYDGRRFEFTLAQATAITVDAVADDFNPYLLILDGDEQILHEDDDSGQGNAARIAIQSLEAGTYLIEVTSAQANMDGPFLLTITLGVNICFSNLGYLPSGALNVMDNVPAGCMLERDNALHGRYYTFSLASESDVAINATTTGFNPTMTLRRGGATLTGANVGSETATTMSVAFESQRLSADHYTLEIGGNATGSINLMIRVEQVARPTPTPPPTPTPVLPLNEAIRLEPNPSSLAYRPRLVYEFILAGNEAGFPVQVRLGNADDFTLSTAGLLACTPVQLAGQGGGGVLGQAVSGITFSETTQESTVLNIEVDARETEVWWAYRLETPSNSPLSATASLSLTGGMGSVTISGLEPNTQYRVVVGLNDQLSGRLVGETFTTLPPQSGPALQDLMRGDQVFVSTCTNGFRNSLLEVVEQSGSQRVLAVYQLNLTPDAPTEALAPAPSDPRIQVLQGDVIGFGILLNAICSGAGVRCQVAMIASWFSLGVSVLLASVPFLVAGRQRTNPLVLAISAGIFILTQALSALLIGIGLWVALLCIFLLVFLALLGVIMKLKALWQ